MDVDLTQRMVDGYLVLEVRGEVDVHSAPTLSTRLTQLVDAGNSCIVLDLGWLSFIDSTGLGALVAARNHAVTAGVTLRLAGTTDRVQKLLRITGLDAVFDTFPTVAAAVATPLEG